MSPIAIFPLCNLERIASWGIKFAAMLCGGEGGRDNILHFRRKQIKSNTLNGNSGTDLDSL